MRKEFLLVLPHLKLLAKALPEEVKIDRKQPVAASTCEEDLLWAPAVLVPYCGKKAAENAAPQVVNRKPPVPSQLESALVPLRTWAWKHAGSTLRIYWWIFRLFTQFLPVFGLNAILYLGLVTPLLALAFPVMCGQWLHDLGGYLVAEVPGALVKSFHLLLSTAFAGQQQELPQCWFDGHALYNDTEAAWQTPPPDGPPRARVPLTRPQAPPAKVLFHPPTPPSTWPESLASFVAHLAVTWLAVRKMGGHAEA